MSRHDDRDSLIEQLEKLINMTLESDDDYYTVALNWADGCDVVVITSMKNGSQIIKLTGESNRELLIDVMKQLDLNKLAGIPEEYTTGEEDDGEDDDY